jgi:hypothetical protein
MSESYASSRWWLDITKTTGHIGAMTRWER